MNDVPADAQWMTIKEAVDYGADHEVLMKHAAAKIIDALKSEKIRSRAKIMTRKIAEGTWSDEDLILHGLDWERATTEPSYLSIYEGTFSYAVGLTGIETSGNREVWRAEGIELFRQHVEKLWPADAANKPSPVDIQNKGGAPEKHNWSEAFEFVGSWVFKNGLPKEKKRLTELTIEWFTKNEGGAPKDPRELSRRVSAAYDALKGFLSNRSPGV